MWHVLNAHLHASITLYLKHCNLTVINDHKSLVAVRNMIYDLYPKMFVLGHWVFPPRTKFQTPIKPLWYSSLVCIRLLLETFLPTYEQFSEILLSCNRKFVIKLKSFVSMSLALLGTGTFILKEIIGLHVVWQQKGPPGRSRWLETKMNLYGPWHAAEKDMKEIAVSQPLIGQLLLKLGFHWLNKLSWSCLKLASRRWFLCANGD